MSTKPFWMLPAAVVWVATRNADLADELAHLKTRHAADKALAATDPARYGVKPWADVVSNLRLPGRDQPKSKRFSTKREKAKPSGRTLSASRSTSWSLRSLRGDLTRADSLEGSTYSD